MNDNYNESPQETEIAPIDLAIGEDGSVMVILQQNLYNTEEEMSITLDYPLNRLILEQDGHPKLGMSTEGTEALDIISDAPDLHIVEDAGDETYNLFVQVSIQEIRD